MAAHICSEFTGHSCQVNVARYAPSGFYIASGDVQGNVKIWDTTQEEHLVKTDIKVFSGRVVDVAWDSESKRIVAGGEGKDKFGHAFMFDSGSSVGEISGHSKVINSCSIRSVRPFRAATASDDLSVNFYNGVPYKFVKSIKDHSRFVQCVKYSPDGNFFVTAGMDSKLFLYEGKEGNKVSELSSSANTHTGGILSVSWSPDSKRLMTASSDSTVKLWDVEKAAVIGSCKFNGGVEDQQVGCLWSGQNLISVSLGGDINYFNSSDISKPTRVIRGHSKGLTALSVKSDKTFYTGSYDGRVCHWEAGTSKVLDGGHSNQVVHLDSNGDYTSSIAMDDTMKKIETADFKASASFKFDHQPKALSSFKNFDYVLDNENTLNIFKDSEKLATLTLGFNATALAISTNGQELAVGEDSGKVHLFKVHLGEISEQFVHENNRGSITSLSYSPDGKWLAAADSQRAILVFDTAEKTLKFNQWVFHTAKVNSIAWSPDSKYAVSTSVDTNVEIWNIAAPMKHICIKNAHLESANDAKFLDNETIVSVGQDGFVKIWKLSK